ncbi:TonB-dependent receptor [Massilia aurea]|uniref:TonB-dependent receptor domain-containing protein n=1 Tax=Massilia aurea TaxID=373040 RepID=UPI003461BF06
MRSPTTRTSPSDKPAWSETLNLAVALLLASAGASALAQTAPEAAAVAAPAEAEAAPAAPAPAAIPMQSIVVSSSRIDRAGFKAPTPTTIIGAQAIAERAAVNVGDVLNEIPAFRASNSATSGTTSTGVTFTDLRGLGANRTLVLLGRNRLPLTFNGNVAGAAGVDLNMVPTSLIQSVDVVTGGASAAYGSDAVAGVVNIRLKDRIDGVQGSIQYGQAEEGDARDKTISLAGGTTFANGRGRIIAGGEYNDNSGVANYYERDWGRRENAVFAVPGVRAAGVPANLIADGIRIGNMAPGGLIQNVATNPAALRGQQFVTGADGSIGTTPFDYGQYASGTTMVGGGIAGNSVYGVFPLRTPVERASFMSRLTYDLSDDVSLYVEPSFARSKGGGTTQIYFNPAVSIARDNAYLPASIAAQMGTTPLRVGYSGNNLGAPQLENVNEAARLAVGLNGAFGESWKWDVNLQSARSNFEKATSNNVINANMLRAIDAVTVTPANVGSSGLALGSVACRSTLTAPTNGCAPFNLFGSSTPSDAARAYILGTAQFKQVSKLQEASANLQGEPFENWAGPVSVAGGVAYRKEELESSADALSSSAAFNVNNVQPINGALNVKEVYLETLVPLAAKMTGIHALDLNAAARRTDYSTSGAVTTWKVGLNYAPVADVRLRATRSRDIRAPNLSELFSSRNSATQNLFDPRPEFNRSYVMTAYNGGNRELQPEVSDTTTVGVVFEPVGFKRLSMSVDYYKIDVKSAITTLAFQTLINNCLRDGKTSDCAFLTYGADNSIAAVSGVNANVGELRTDGVDLQLAYTQPLKEWSDSLAGTVNFAVQGTRVFELWSSGDVTPATPDGINRAGQTGVTGGIAKWTWNVNATYKLGPWSTTGQLRHISRGHFNNGFIGPDDAAYSPTLANSINDNEMPSATYFNWRGSYEIGGKGSPEVFFAVNNVFDRAPPLPANGIYHDVIGRSFSLGMRARF